MAKVLEGPGMGLLQKWGLKTPHYVVVDSGDEFDQLATANDWLSKSKLVVKAHEALGSRFKLRVGQGWVGLGGCQGSRERDAWEKGRIGYD